MPSHAFSKPCLSFTYASKTGAGAFSKLPILTKVTPLAKDVTDLTGLGSKSVVQNRNSYAWGWGQIAKHSKQLRPYRGFVAANSPAKKRQRMGFSYLPQSRQKNLSSGVPESVCVSTYRPRLPVVSTSLSFTTKLWLKSDPQACRQFLQWQR
jgi:hypothetical protein